MGADIPDGELGVVDAFVFRAKELDELVGEQQEDHRGRQAHQGLHRHEPLHHLHNPVIPLGSDVVTRDGDAACGQARRDGNDDLEEFHYDADDSGGDLGVFRLAKYLIHRPKFHRHIKRGRHGEDNGDLGQEAGRPQREDLAHQIRAEAETVLVQLHSLHPEQVCRRQGGGHDLPGNGGDSRTGYAPTQDVNTDRVKDDVQHCPQRQGRHGKAGTAVGTDDGVHGLTEHIERDTQSDPKEIFFGKPESLIIDPGAKGVQDRHLEHKVDPHQHQADRNDRDDGAADAPAGVVLLLRAETDTDKGAASVSDHDGDGDGHHRHGKHHRVGGVPIRAKIVGVGDENLIDDIVKCRHQHRDHAGDGKFPHELSNALMLQKAICV